MDKVFDQKIQRSKPDIYRAIENVHKAAQSLSHDATTKTILEITDWVKNCLDTDNYEGVSELNFPDSRILEDLPQEINTSFQDVKYKFLILIEIFVASKRKYTYEQAKEKAEQIKVGMNKSEIKEILGDPNVNDDLVPESAEWLYYFGELVGAPQRDQKSKALMGLTLKFNNDKLDFITKDY